MLILNYHVAIATFVVVVLHTLIMDMNFELPVVSLNYSLSRVH